MIKPPLGGYPPPDDWNLMIVFLGILLGLIHSPWLDTSIQRLDWPDHDRTVASGLDHIMG